jgi:nucleotide-binding universal stress UspA family protein
MNPVSTPSRRDAESITNQKPDLAVPPAASPIAPELQFARILVPVDFSEHSLKAFQKAVAFARQFGSELILTHIVEQIIYPGDWMYPPLAMSDFASEKREEIAGRLKALAAESGVRSQQIVRIGRAWQEIVEIAKERKADLLILATHGYTGLKHALLGSVAEKIVRHAPCPVLTVRAEDGDFQ